MCYLSGGLFHQNKFPVKFGGPNLFFLWLLVFYYLTDAFVLVLFTSSTSHPHPLCRSSPSQMFFKIGVPKNFADFTGKCRGFQVKYTKCLRTLFLQNTSGGCFYLCYFSWMFLFYFSLTALPPLPYSTVTFFVWRNTLVFISLLLHCYYHNSQMIHQDCCNRHDLLYCNFHDSYTY